MTVRECAIVQAFTGVCMLSGDRLGYFYRYLESIMGRPVFTHELKSDEICQLIKEKSYNDFINLCATAKEE